MIETTDSLQGRVALITGGARGIGKAIAERFIEQGARVVIADNGGEINGTNPDPTVVEQAARQLGDHALGCFVDVGSADAARTLVDTVLNQWGRLDIVINNAAILRDHFIFKANPADYEEVVRVNLAGYYYVLAAATPVLREQTKQADPETPFTEGRIVNLVSTAGFYGNYGQSAYASAKNGIVGMTRTVALDLARAKITVNAVAPFARSRVTEIIAPANEAQATYKERALKIDPGYVASVVNWLCSDFGKDITGQLFGVRGREVFLFSQPRPVRKFDMSITDPASLAQQAEDSFDDAYTDLVTDLESFNSEPLV